MSQTGRRRPNPADLPVREAIQRFLRRRKTDRADSTIDTYYGRLKLFADWAEGVGIERVGDLQPYDLNEFYDVRSGSVAGTTVENEMNTLIQFCEFLETLGATDKPLSENIPKPDLDKEERSSDEQLHHRNALPLLQNFRESETQYGTRAHAFLELAWFTGARIGGLRALDLRDVKQGENYVEIHHRPSTDTPLKNKRDGERPVAIPAESMQAVASYLQTDRYDSRDEHGRQPLLASARGRPTPNTIRTWSYQATLPCTTGSCPHGKEIDACEWTDRANASKCPSSRSPHPIRTGTITWMLNLGVPRDVVRYRCDTDQFEHYDKPSEDERWNRFRERMEDRRRQHIDSLDPFNDDSE